jgi:hypothetical protein
LYSTRGERIAASVHESARGRLESQLGAFLDSEEPVGEWRRLRLDRWSLATLGAPVYPQNRFQLGVVWAVASRFALTNEELRVTIAGPANRWTGVRTRTELRGPRQVKAAAEHYWLNARPRWVGAEPDEFATGLLSAPPPSR